MTKALPTKIYLVDRTPPSDEIRGRYRAPYGPLRRFYAAWAHVKLFVASHDGRSIGARTYVPSTFKVYEADVTWREVEL